MRDAAAALHASALVVDTHVHPPRFLPGPVHAAYKWATRRTFPPEVGFGDLVAAGVDAVVVKAVGDPVVTAWHGRAWPSVLAQLDAIGDQAAGAGAVLASDAAAVRRARADGRVAAVLGLEGADAIGDDVSRLDTLAERGVRVIVPVHLRDNQLGTTSLPWQQYVGPIPTRRRTPGLTELGRRAVTRMDELGIVVDVAHCDTPTLQQVVECTRHPVVATHSGARALQDFPRFVSDDEIRAIARTGGVVGLWPYRHRGKGVADVADLVAHARHLAHVAGPEHVCIGTDMNGVPGLMDGYRSELDLPVVTAALLDAGFGDADVRGILGENFLRVFEAVATT